MKNASDPEVKADPNPVPTAVAWLGYGGLLPFLATASGSWLATAQVTFWQQALLFHLVATGLIADSPQAPANRQQLHQAHNLFFKSI